MRKFTRWIPLIIIIIAVILILAGAGVGLFLNMKKKGGGEPPKKTIKENPQEDTGPSEEKKDTNQPFYESTQEIVQVHTYF